MLLLMANHAAQGVTRAGIVPAYTAAANGDTCDCGDTTVLFVKNAAGAPINVTIAATAGQGGLELEDLVVAVAAGTTRAIGPIVASLFADHSTGKASVAYSDLVTITVACLSV